MVNANQARRLAVLGTGGTIAGRATRANDNVGYVAGQVSVADLVGAVPVLQGLSLDVEQVAQLDSKDMGFAVWKALAARVAFHLERPEVAGIVITHGTDTIEETAFFLQSVLRPGKPVVLTCAMRPATALVPDGPQNLSDAVAVARQAGAFVFAGGLQVLGQRHQLGGAMLLEGELGVGVDVAADGGQLVLEGADAFDEAHGCTMLSGSVAGRSSVLQAGGRRITVRALEAARLV